MSRRLAAAVVLAGLLTASAASAAGESVEYHCTFGNLPDLYIQMTDAERVRVGLAPGIGNKGRMVETDAAMVVTETDSAGMPITFTTILQPSLRAYHSRHVVDLGTVIPSQGKGECAVLSRTRPTADAGQSATQ